MQLDFHYYATYCAAWLAGYSAEESLEISYSAQFVDCCSKTFLSKIKAPLAAATTQLQLELMDMRKDIIGLADITRIWTSFHFLPYDLYAQKKGCSRFYLNKYRLICNVSGDLLTDTVELAKGGSLQAVGIAMHVLADTWAHRFFAGTPSMVINNINSYFYEIYPEGETERERQIIFHRNLSVADDPETGDYIGTLIPESENSVMCLGHGRAGHLPDYSFMRYRYLPAWGNYRVICKDNPSDYMSAFCQMIHAMKYLRGECDSFEKGYLDREAAAPYEKEIRKILEKRQLDASADWRDFAERLTGKRIEDFAIDKYQEEYVLAEEKSRDETILGKFILASMNQKSMVTNKIFKSGSLLAGFSIDFSKEGFKGIRDYFKLVDWTRKGNA